MLLGLVAFALIASVSYKDYVKRTQGLEPSIFPESQLQFHRLNRDCVPRYREGINEVQKSLAFNKCNEERTQFAAQNSMSGWVGTIERIATDQGADVVQVDISSSAAGFTVGYHTDNNRFSNIFSRTMIRPGTPLFERIAKLPVGQKVIFDGSFVKDPGNSSKILEYSLTESGSMTAPVFIVEFSDIRPFTTTVTATAPVEALPKPTENSWRPPKFVDYPVDKIYSGPPAQLVMSDEFPRDYRARFSDGLNGKPDFAGEYVLVSWGCGTSCIVQSFINKRTGRILDYEFGGEGGEIIEAMRANSRLIVTKGSVYDDEENEIDYRVKFYVLESETLKLVDERSIAKPADEQESTACRHALPAIQGLEYGRARSILIDAGFRPARIPDDADDLSPASEWELTKEVRAEGQPEVEFCAIASGIQRCRMLFTDLDGNLIPVLSVISESDGEMTVDGYGSDVCTSI